MRGSVLRATTHGSKTIANSQSKLTRAGVLRYGREPNRGLYRICEPRSADTQMAKTKMPKTSDDHAKVHFATNSYMIFGSLSEVRAGHAGAVGLDYSIFDAPNFVRRELLLFLQILARCSRVACNCLQRPLLGPTVYDSQCAEHNLN